MKATTLLLSCVFTGLLAATTGCESSLASYVGEARDARLQGDLLHAHGSLEQALRQASMARDHGEPPSKRDVERLQSEVSAFKSWVRQKLSSVLATEGAIPGKGLIATYARLYSYPEFSGFQEELLAQVREASTRQCADLRTQHPPTTPYWAWFLNRYCILLGAPGMPTPPLTLPASDLVSALTVDVELDGVDAEATSGLSGALAAWFRTTPFFHDHGTHTARLIWRGRYQATFDRQATRVSAPWSEDIPYQDTEMVPQSYEEPYQTSEQYTESIPYTDTEYYTEQCGSPSSPAVCTRSRQVTKYRTSLKSRWVTKYRTATRMVPQTVTRYRTQRHTHQFDAQRHTGKYHSQNRLELVLGAIAEPIVIDWNKDLQQVGLQHDEMFAPAGVQPSRPDLMTHRGWYERNLAGLLGSLHDALDQRFSGRYCSENPASLEDAARCAYLSVRPLPPAVLAMLSAPFGNATQQVLTPGNEPLAPAAQTAPETQPPGSSAQSEVSATAPSRPLPPELAAPPPAMEYRPRSARASAALLGVGGGLMGAGGLLLALAGYTYYRADAPDPAVMSTHYQSDLMKYNDTVRTAGYIAIAGGIVVGVGLPFLITGLALRKGSSKPAGSQGSSAAAPSERR